MLNIERLNLAREGCQANESKTGISETNRYFYSEKNGKEQLKMQDAGFISCAHGNFLQSFTDLLYFNLYSV